MNKREGIARPPGGWSWWLRWVLANSMAGSVIGFAGYYATMTIGGLPTLLLSVAATWAVVGAAQSIVLPKPIRRRAWILADVVGGVAGTVLGMWLLIGWWALITSVSESAGFAIGVVGLVAGAVIGVAQSRALRDRIPNRWGWLVANAAAGGAGWIVGWGVTPVFGVFTGSAAGWAAGAAITGLALRSLLRDSAD